jgi:pimeloyl-ACP methyl ester carboxylesterase
MVSYNLEIVRRAPAQPSTNPPLLFVHGVCHGAWCWDEYFLPYFAAQGWDAYALSLRGHAGSEGRDRLHQFGLQDYVDDVFHVASQLDRKPVVIGHSMGGGITQLAMRRDPERLAGAVLFASMPPGWNTRWESLRMLRNPLGLVATHRLLSEKSFSARDVRRMPFMGGRITLEQAACYAPLLQPESSRAVEEIPQMNTPSGPVPFPLLVMGASSDIIFGASAVRRTAAHYHTDAVVLDQGCHDLMIDPNWRESADVILNWLNRNYSR